MYQTDFFVEESTLLSMMYPRDLCHISLKGSLVGPHRQAGSLDVSVCEKEEQD
jgi:hypothetical protein